MGRPSHPNCPPAWARGVLSHQEMLVTFSAGWPHPGARAGAAPVAGIAAGSAGALAPQGAAGAVPVRPAACKDRRVWDRVSTPGSLPLRGDQEAAQTPTSVHVHTPHLGETARQPSSFVCHMLCTTSPAVLKRFPEWKSLLKTGVDSPTENILGSAQESCCQHPASTLSPAPVSPAWLGCQYVLAKSLPSQSMTPRINPFYS